MDAFSDLLKPQSSGNDKSNGKSTGLNGSSMSSPSRGSTPQNDSFAGLASLAASTTGANKQKSMMAKMSLQERQKLQAAEQERAKASQNSSWAGLDLLGGGSSTSKPSQPAVGPGSTGSSTPLDSMIGESNSSIQVDSVGTSSPGLSVNSTGTSMPFDSIGTTSPGLSANSTGTSNNDAAKNTAEQSIDDLFDVFNKPPPKPQLDQVENQAPKHDSRNQSTDKDRDHSQSPLYDGSAHDHSEPPQPAAREDPRDGPIAELVDMGFSADQAREALANTETGLNINQAIDYLMKQAHQKSRPSTASPTDEETNTTHRQNQSGPMDSDIGKMAQEFSATFISKAGKFWNQGRKNVAKAIEQYQQSSGGGSGAAGDENTPAWMRDAAKYRNYEENNNVRRTTQEAAALDMPAPEKPARRSRGSPREGEESGRRFHTSASSSDGWQEHRTRSETRRGSDREQVPDRQAQTPEPRASSRPKKQEPALSRAQRFKISSNDDDAMYSPRNRSRPSTPGSASASSTASIPTKSKPKMAPRNQPTISPTAMEMINEGRKSGTEAYKRGDYAQAVQCFSRSLESIPPKHTLQTVMLSNRAACYILSGDPKAASADADQGILIIGAGMGAGEEVEPGKSLKDIWAKLLTKRAEANEQMEKHQEALDAWNMLMNNGFSNKAALEGRRRCQAALAPKSKPKPKPAASSAAARAAPSVSNSNGPTSKAGREAVDRVRNANKQAEQMDTEKYALLDQVENRIAGWKQGKEDNLRALLASLDTILWSELQWKKVSMAELVLPKKVKIAYMKAVAKTHPDKITSETPTEQKMIANAVFITLNSAWDGFKKENGLS